LNHLKTEIKPEGDLKSYKQRLVSSFFFKFFLTASGGGSATEKSATEGTYFRAISSGDQEFHVDEKDKDPAFKPIPKVEGKIQASGEARYVADTSLEEGTLFASVVGTTVASGKILEINYKKALAYPGVVDVVTHKDVPGANIYPKMSLFPIPPATAFAADKVEYYGQPIAVIIAKSKREADAAIEAVEIKYEKGDPILTVQDARDKKSTYGFPLGNALKVGDAKGELEKAKHKISGQVFIGSQKHFYMEPQSVYVQLDEEGQIIVHTAGQFHGGMPDNLSVVLKIPSSKIKIILRRAGGAFGGKAVPPFLFMILTAVAAWKLKKPVMLTLPRDQDMTIVGGREETLEDYEAAFDEKGKILAIKHDVQLGGGFSPDLSFFVAMVINHNLHQVYDLRNLELTSAVWKTSMCTRTAVRGPGEPGASYLIENIISQIAFNLGITAEEVREANFYDEKEKEPKAPSGKILMGFTVPTLWKKVKDKVKWSERLTAVQKYNKENRWKKRGVAITPVNYGVHIMAKDALVNINNDGTIVIHHTACEMGQGLNTKVAQIAASELGKVLGTPLDTKLVRFADGNSSVIPNGRGTGGSTGSEATVQAVRTACQTLVNRLKQIQELLIKDAEEKAKKESETPSTEGKQAQKLTWEGLCAAADGKSVDLQAKARYADFEHKEESFSYNNYGACFSEVEVDVLTGEVNVIESNLTYDCGKSLNPAIDIGQVEGAYMMGLGHVLREREEYSKDGKLLTVNTWTYKPPGARDVPQRFVVELIQNEDFKK